MKYKDPITGELRDVIIKSGDTLPIGTIVEFDGDTIPDGYEEFETQDYGSLGEIIVDDIICKNIFNKNLYLTDYAPNASNNNNKIVYSYGAVIIYMPIEGGKTYTFSRKSGVRLRAFTTTSIPTKDVAISNYQADDTATKMTINTNYSDKYLCFYCYNYSLETRTKEEAFNEIQVEPGPVATDYVEHKDFENKETYSTNEQVIGTWIDGKPLYRKVYETSELTANEVVIDTFTNLEVKMIYGWFFKDDGTCQPYGLFYNTESTNTSRAFSAGGAIKVQQNTNFQNKGYKARVIAEYTKTTD